MSTRALIILTGASRGLGAAMAAQLRDGSVRLLTLSRRPDPALTTGDAHAGALNEQWSVDLNDGVAASRKLEAWLGQQDRTQYASATLINNAAVAGRAVSIDQEDAESLASVLRVGLEAPLLLMSAFLRATRDWNIPRKVLNISSGAGKKSLSGAAAYCAVKAGLDHLSRVVALDETLRANSAKIVSLAPGVIDTDMQTALRESDPNDFPSQPLFAEMKASGQLSSPHDAAARVLAYLGRADFGTHPVADVRDS